MIGAPDDAIGGEAIGLAGLHAVWLPPFEWTRDYRIQLQAYANVGNCIALPCMIPHH